MRTYMARLGNFQFSVETAAFQELQRASTYRWQAKERIGRRPAQQNTGIGADTINLSGTIYPHYRGGLGQIDALRQQALNGEPLPLVYAFETAGQYCGLWCVTAIEETRTVFFDNGQPRRIDFRLTLVEYGEDSDATSLIPLAAIAAAPIVATVDAAGAASEAASLAKEASAVTSQAGALSMIGKAASVAQTVSGTISTAVNSVLNSDAVRLAKRTVSEVNNLRAAAAGLSSAVNGLSGIASNPGSALTALGNLAASAGTMSDVLGSATSQIGLTADAYGGGLYRQQIASATSTLGALGTAASSIKSAAASLQGHF